MEEDAAVIFSDDIEADLEVQSTLHNHLGFWEENDSSE